jgi:hypothetical protein
MKHIKKIYTVLASSVLIFGSCEKNFLERPPLNIVGEESAYGSLSGIESLSANLYNSIQFEDHDFMIGTGYLSMYSDEAVPSYTWTSYGPTIPTNTLGWWGYNQIRQVNEFIEKLPTANITDQERERFIAEARFIRAFHYFNMVKRYGGVPLITSTQSYDQNNIDALQVPRSKEKEVFDFISTELEEVSTILPISYTLTQGQNRVTRWAALALQSRAMLYAASIAKYGNVELDGLVGIPSDLANSYWEKSKQASKRIIDEGGFELYAKNEDKAKNFQELFINGDDPLNKEKILVKSYVFPGKGHYFDFYNQPNNFWKDYSSLTNPTLEMVEAFEYVDGSDGKLKISDSQGNAIKYNAPEDLFANKDPRMFATIITPNTDWAFNGITAKVELRRGIIDNNTKITSGAINPSEVYGEGENKITIVGAAGPLQNSGDATKTGFYLKKYLTQNAGQLGAYGNSITPYLVFRYAEILLNYSEACIELGQNQEALNSINLIRDRAGIAQLNQVSLEKIRHERRVELAFENHRFWDLKRWRIATEVINNKQPYSLFPWLNWEDGKSPSEMKYTFESIATAKNPLTFPSILYYEPIPNAGMPYLIQNIGY